MKFKFWNDLSILFLVLYVDFIFICDNFYQTELIRNSQIMDQLTTESLERRLDEELDCLKRQLKDLDEDLEKDWRYIQIFYMLLTIHITLLLITVLLIITQLITFERIHKITEVTIKMFQALKEIVTRFLFTVRRTKSVILLFFGEILMDCSLKDRIRPRRIDALRIQANQKKFKYCLIYGYLCILSTASSYNVKDCTNPLCTGCPVSNRDICWKCENISMCETKSIYFNYKYREQRICLDKCPENTFMRNLNKEISEKMCCESCSDWCLNGLVPLVIVFKVQWPRK